MWEKLHRAAFCGHWSHRAWENSLRGRDVYGITNTSAGGADNIGTRRHCVWSLYFTVFTEMRISQCLLFDKSRYEYAGNKRRGRGGKSIIHSNFDYITLTL